MAKSSTTNRRVNLYINGKEAATTISEVRAEMQRLVNQQAKMKIGSEEYIASAKRIRSLRTILEEHKRQQQDIRKNWLSLSNMSDTFNKYFGMIAAGIASITGMMMGFRKLSENVAKMDDIYADVEKTTNLTKEEVKELNEEFKKMDTRTSREQLNKLAADAGKLGISGKKDLLDFVDAGNQIDVALGEDLGEGAIKNIGKITQVYKASTKELESLDLKGQMLSVGSAINELGQSSTASEAYLVDFAQRLGGVASQAGISIQNILGYASALDQSGQKVEMSATALQNFIMKLMADPAKFARLAGQNVKEFTNLLQTDTNAAILKVLGALNNKGGFQALIPIFEEMGLDGARAVGVLSALATNINTVQEAQEVSNRGFAEATSITDEYSKKNTNLQAQLEKARKEFNEQALILGEKLNPMLLKSTNGFTYLVKAMIKAPEFFKENRTLITALTGALVTYVAASANSAIQTGLLSAKTATLSGIKKLYNAVTLETITNKERERIATQTYGTILEKCITQEQAALLQKKGLAKNSNEYISLLEEESQRNLKTSEKRIKAINNEVLSLEKDVEAKKKTYISSVNLTTQLRNEYTAQMRTGDATKIATYQNNLETASNNQKAAQTAYLSATRSLHTKKIQLETTAKTHNTLSTKLNTAEEIANDAAKKVSITTTQKLTLATKALWISMKANPLGWILTLVSLAVTAFSAFKKETSETTDEVSRLNSEANKEVKSVDKIINKIKLTTSGTNDRKKAVGELNTVLEKYNIELLKESDGLETLETKYTLLNKAIKENVAERLKQEGLERIMKEQDERQQESLKTLEKALVGRTFNRFGRKDMDAMGATLSEGMRGITIETVGMMQNIATELLTSGKSPKYAYAEFYKRITNFILKESGITYNTLSEAQKANVDRLLKNDLDVTLSNYFSTLDMDIAKYNASIFNLDQQFKNLVPPKTKPQNTEISDLIKSINLMTDKQKLQQLINHENEAVQAAAKARLTVLNNENTSLDDLIKLKEKELEEAQQMPGGTKEEIAARNKKVAAIQDEIAELKKLGLEEKETAQKKEELEEKLAKTIKEIQNKLHLDTLNDRDREIAEEQFKHAELIALAEEWGLDTTKLNEAIQQKIAAINKKYDDKALEDMKKAQEILDDYLMSDAEKKKAAIIKKYADLWEAAQKAKKDTPELKQKMDSDQNNELAAINTENKDIFGMTPEDWDILEEKMNNIKSIAGELANVWGQFNEIQNNRDKKELQEYEKSTNRKKELLNKQLNSGRISQEKYNAQVAELDAELEKKKTDIARKQAKRDKAQNIFSAIINTAAAVVKALPNIPLSILAGLLGAAQIAVIASQPLPEYAQGGMTDGARMYIAGEAGREWIAPNNMVTNPVTGPIIQQLELVRTGVLSPEQLKPVLPDFTTMTTIPMYSTGGSTGSVQNTTNYYQSSTNDPQLLETVQSMRDEIKVLNTYLSDPKNRQAFITNDLLKQQEKEMNLLNYLKHI